MRRTTHWVALLGWGFIAISKGGVSGPKIPVPMGGYENRADCERLSIETGKYAYVTGCVETDITTGWSFIAVGKGGIGPNIPVGLGIYKDENDCNGLVAEIEPYAVYVSHCVKINNSPQ